MIPSKMSAPVPDPSFPAILPLAQPASPATSIQMEKSMLVLDQTWLLWRIFSLADLAVGRKAGPEAETIVCSLDLVKHSAAIASRVHFSHAFSRGFDNVSILAGTKAARCFEHPSSSLFQYWQLKSPKAFGTRDHHIRHSVNVVAIPGDPSWRTLSLMGANPRPRCSNQSRNRFQEILGIYTYTALN